MLKPPLHWDSSLWYAFAVASCYPHFIKRETGVSRSQTCTDQVYMARNMIQNSNPDVPTSEDPSLSTKASCPGDAWLCVCGGGVMMGQKEKRREEMGSQTKAAL